MRSAGWNGDHSYSIILAVTTYLEVNVTCMIVQYKKNWIIIRWLGTILKMLKPEEEQFFINNSPVFGTGLNSSNRTTVSKL
jgi:hypothetical protein